ncbi:ankyrin repeat domain-containing protein 27-like isoform X2 [Myxocyprinus asiaticus]|uniref:ankyrin repeat domain-containing protein 27-like isoform X2 n=1 Tax=Myxocyprinus asiaticus TaxID=70543 RepID=UPI00222320CA|nr:ankyrin repeat domain-containing protein 27-like isoform X2 [Myxocyprinus asiaticus]
MFSVPLYHLLHNYMRIPKVTWVWNNMKEPESGTHMALYDENILKNPFYLHLEKLRPDLLNRVAELHGIILVPCRGSLRVGSITAAQFDGYVIQPAEQGYQTLDGKEVSIENNQVRLASGSLNPILVSILFEETFYNEKEQAYSVLCIARPLDSDHSPEELSSVSAPYYLKNIDDVREFLGHHAEKLVKYVATFCRSFKEQERKGLRYQIDSVNTLYTKCLQCLLKDSHLLFSREEIQMTLVKQAVEMYIHHGIYDLLFSFVGTLEASRDASFNKRTRSLEDLRQKDLGVKSEFSVNIPRAKRELSQLNICTSPQQKLLCLRKVIYTVMQSPRNRDTVNIEAVCADDLLPVILYLLIKTEIPNWMANLSYIKNFHFFNSIEDDLSYCLASFEAAVEHFRQADFTQSALGSPGILSFRQKMDLLSQNAATTIDCLFEHIASGNEAEVKRLLSESESEEDGRKMCHPLCSCDTCDLHISGRLNDPSIVTPFSRDDRGYTPLHVAAICGQSQLIDLLVSKGAVVNATDYYALTPLHLSCQKGYQGVTLLLLHYKANTDAQDNNGNTPLHLACMYGHEDCVKGLVYFDLHSCRLNVQNDKGDTPLHIAARWGYEGIMEVLLENGASTLIHNKAKETPLHCALNSKILSLLEHRYIDSSKRESGFESPSRSPQASDFSSRRSSVSSMSSVSVETSVPETERTRHKEVEKLLRAVADGDVEMVRYLLEWVGEEPEEEEVGMPIKTELCHPLCQCSNCEPTQKKIARLQPDGLGVNSSSVDGFTPLHVAALHGHTTLVSLLTRHGANINARNNQSATPLHLACQNSHIQVVSALLECNAKPNKKDHYGNTPLIHACLKGHLEIATVLLESGVLVNLANNHGNTGLHEAVRGGHVQLVELLLHRRALVHIRNKRQRTALDCAYETGGKDTDIQRLLQKACALGSDLIKAEGILAHSVVHRVKQHDSPDCGRQETDHTKQRTQKRLNRAVTITSLSEQTADSQSNRLRMKRGETVDSSGPFCHPQTQQSPNTKTKGLTRCHTISQDLTQHSLQTPQHIFSEHETQEEIINGPQDTTDSCDHSPETSPDPKQLNGDSVVGRDEEEEEEREGQSRGSDVDSATTEMDNVVL